ncbi:MAG: hypothetical protein ABI620_06155 [Chloroflexota bacterium]
MSARDDRAAREQRFEEELGRVSRSLVTEELPRDVLSEPVSASLGLGRAVDGSVSARRPLPGLATAAAVAVVLLLATVVVVAPQLPGGPGPSASPAASASPTPTTAPVFRTSAEIRTDFEALEYTCRAGQVLASVAPGPSAFVRESVICTPVATDVFMAAVIVGESASGVVVEVHAKADFVGADTPTARAAVASTLAKAAAIVVRAGTGTAVGSWVESNVPAIESNGVAKAQVDGYAVLLKRTSDGGYQLTISIAATS